MDQIGLPNISPIEAAIFFIALALEYGLRRLAANSLASRVLAVFVGCCVVGVIPAILFYENLTERGVPELAIVGMALAFRLVDWNAARIKLRAANPREIPT